MRPNYFNFMEYLKTRGRERVRGGVDTTPQTASESAATTPF